jgi:hypothetical protein
MPKSPVEVVSDTGLVCAGCGEAWFRWMACPVCGFKFVTPRASFRPSQLPLWLEA